MYHYKNCFAVSPAGLIWGLGSRGLFPSHTLSTATHGFEHPRLSLYNPSEAFTRLDRCKMTELDLKQH